jgi:hypothetical protein
MFRSVTTRLSGLIILIAGIWGGLIPFVGPYFHFALGPDHAWRWTSGRLYLDILPAVAAVLGGLLLLGAGPWLSGRIGALLALAGGIWFAVGPDVSRLWHSGGAQGVAHGHGGTRMLEYLTFHSGLGVLITALAAYALPGFVATRRRVRRGEAEAAGGVVAAEETRRHDGVGAREGEPVRDREPVAAGEPGAEHRGGVVGGRERVSEEPGPGATERP